MIGPKVTGRVTPMDKYVFPSGTYTFHTARTLDGHTAVFRVLHDCWPSDRARQLEMVYSTMRNSTQDEINDWLKNRSEESLVSVVESKPIYSEGMYGLK